MRPARRAAGAAAGARKGTALAAVLSILSLTAVGLAQSPVWLMAGLAIGGLGNAVAQPSANLGISEFVTEQRLGRRVRHQAVLHPGGDAAGRAGRAGHRPGVRLALGGGRRGGAGDRAADLVAGHRPRRRGTAPGRPRAARRDKGLPRGGLVVLTLGGFLGSAAATSTGVFLVDSAVASGVAPGTAGFLFAACSVLGLTSRVGFGWLADRHADRSRYLFIANLLAGGAVGYGLLATGRIPLVVAGSLLAYGMGWAWTGLFHFAVIKDNRAAAASVTGFVQTGLSLGAATGPLVFGIVAQTFSYTAAWLTAGVLSLLARGHHPDQPAHGPPVPRAAGGRAAAPPTGPARRRPGAHLTTCPTDSLEEEGLS